MKSHEWERRRFARPSSSGRAFGDFALDLLHQPFTLAARSKIPFEILIPRRFFYPLKPVSELSPFLFTDA
jgi:hypothetical protein